MRQGEIDFGQHDPAPPTEPNPEVVARDAALRDLGDRYADTLRWLRKRLEVIYKVRCEDDREGAYVTADDARKIIDAMPEFNGVCRNFLGRLFLAPGWEFTGRRVNSKTKGSHGNELKCWRWRG